METEFDQLFEQFKKVPDWDKYPLPEFMYKKYGIRKPKPAEINEIVTYTAPPHESLNKDGKVDLLPLPEGGVREVPAAPEMPVEVKLLNDEGEEIPMPPQPKPEIQFASTLPSSTLVEELNRNYDLPPYIKKLEQANL